MITNNAFPGGRDENSGNMGRTGSSAGNDQGMPGYASNDDDAETELTSLEQDDDEVEDELVSDDSTQPDLTEEDLEENDLTDEEADDVEWEEPSK